MTKISLITVAYNCEQTIEKTFESVFNQNYRSHIEYIVVDGASTDTTISLIKKNQSKIDKWISEPDNGIYDAMNKGLKMASGEWIGFLHADDELANNRVIKDIFEIIEKNSCNVIYGDLQYVGASDTSTIIRLWESQPFKKELLKRGWMPPHPTLYLKKSLFSKIGEFNTSYKIAADYDFILRLFSNPETQSKYLPSVLVKMRMGGASNKSIKNLIQKSKEDYRALSNNNIGGIMALFIKNSSKIIQFIKR